VGLLAQFSGWLREFGRDSHFSGMDIPLVGPALDKVLAFNDSFYRKVFFDEGTDGTDDGTQLTDTHALVTDINKALQAKGLGGQILAEAVGDKIRLVAIDSNISSFEVTATVPNQLGFDA